MRLSLFLTALATLALVYFWIPRGPASDEATEYANAAAALLESRHINTHRVDWQDIRRQLPNKITGAQDPEDTYPAIRWMIAELDEKHTFLLDASIASEPPLHANSETEYSEPRLYGSPAAADRIVVPPLRTIGRDGETKAAQYAASLRAKVESALARDPCGLIVDLRSNEGGNMWPMLEGLSSLLGPAPLGFFVHKDGTFQEWSEVQTVTVHPVSLPSSRTVKVAVLVSPRTASSGEMVAIALKDRPLTKLFGKPTAGFTTANAPHRLSDGAFLVVTESYVADREKRVINGPLYPNLDVSDASVLQEANAWIEVDCSAD